MEYRKMRIGELAEQLGVERFVIRFWEKEFAIKGQRSHGGQRFYTERDLHKFATIKELLYDRGYTIAGAKKFLKDHKRLPNALQAKTEPVEKTVVVQEQVAEPDIEQGDSSIVASSVTEMAAEVRPEVIFEQLAALHRQLHRLRELL